MDHDNKLAVHWIMTMTYRIIAVTNSWCLLDSVGKPFLLVIKIDVGAITAFTGSPTHLSNTLCGGRSAVSSSTTDKLNIFKARQQAMRT